MADSSTGALHRIERLQDGFLQLLGSSIEGRSKLVAGMLHRDPREATSYWLQLVVSVGIATLGLVVGSTAVIIGAMLVAPLMGPIVALAMGLAAGSPFLVLRSAGRILLSMLLVVGGAAGITALLPYHELNPELMARTAPTALDLLTAAFCALAGVYASLRPGSDTATTAAGTSIGISLVPPLCVCGYGLGTSLWFAARGAALLFLTNLVAIIVVGTVMFVAAGFTRVDAARLDREELTHRQHARFSALIARRLSGLFESRVGPALRFLMPLVLLGVVYVPLRRALNEVAWEVRTRAEVHSAIRGERHSIIESRVRVERHEVEVQLVLLGTSADAAASKARLEREVRRASGVTPKIEVFAVPDATAFAGLESSLVTSRSLSTVAEPPLAELQRGFSAVRSSVEQLWPTASSGAPLAVQVAAVAGEALQIRVVHLGAPLSGDGAESLRRALSRDLERDVAVIDAAVPAEPLDRKDGDLAFITRVTAAVQASRPVPGVSVCVTEPPALAETTKNERERELAGQLQRLLAQHPRVTSRPGPAWSVRLVQGACESAPDHDAPGAGGRGAADVGGAGGAGARSGARGGREGTSGGAVREPPQPSRD